MPPLNWVCPSWWTKAGGWERRWGVRRAPNLVLLLDGRPHGRLDWPFTEDEIVRGLEVLAAAPREGPRQFLGAVVPLGMGRTLDGHIADLDALSRPVLLVFFNPDCPPCWDALPALVELSEEIQVVLAVTAPHALSEDDRQVLRGAGLKAVLDDEGRLARRLAVRVSPTFLIVDQEGVIRWAHEGIVDQEVLRRAVLAVVSEGGTGE